MYILLSLLLSLQIAVNTEGSQCTFNLNAVQSCKYGCSVTNDNWTCTNGATHPVAYDDLVISQNGDFEVFISSYPFGINTLNLGSATLSPPYQQLTDYIGFQLNNWATVNAGGLINLNKGMVMNNGNVQTNAGGSVNWNAGNIMAITPESCSINILPGAFFLINGTSAKIITDVAVHNRGTTQLQMGSITSNLTLSPTNVGRGIFTNEVGGSLLLASSGQITAATTYAQFINNGAIIMDAAKQTFRLLVAVTGTGNVTVNSGLLILDKPSTLSELYLQGGTLGGSANVTVQDKFVFKSGSLNGTGFIMASTMLIGDISYSLKSINQKIIMAQSVSFSQNTGQIDMTNYAAIVANAPVSVSAPINVISSDAKGFFGCMGGITFNTAGSSKISSDSSVYVNFTIFSGTVSVSGNWVSYAPVIINSGASLQMNGSFDLHNKLNCEGTFILNTDQLLGGPGDIYVPGSFVWQQGLIAGSGMFSVTGFATIQGQSSKTLLARSLKVNQLFVNGNGKLELISSNVTVTGYTSITSSFLYHGDNSSSLSFYDNVGVNAGKPTFLSDVNFYGNVNVANQANLILQNGTMSVFGTLQVDLGGTFEMQGGYLDGEVQTQGYFNWLGGVIYGNASFDIGSSPLLVSGGSYKLLQSRTLTLNNGGVILDDFDMTKNSNLVNSNNGVNSTLEFVGARTIWSSDGSGALINRGKLHGNLQYYGTLINSGTIESYSNTIPQQLTKITVHGILQMLNSSVLYIHVMDGDFTEVNVTSQASLNGIMSVIFHDGFAATDNTVIRVLNYETVQGDFTSVVLDSTQWYSINGCTPMAVRMEDSYIIRFVCTSNTTGETTTTTLSTNTDKPSQGADTTNKPSGLTLASWTIALILAGALVMIAGVAITAVCVRKTQMKKAANQTITDENW